MYRFPDCQTCGDESNGTIGKQWIKLSDTRHELRKGTELVGCIHLTDNGWMIRTWQGKSVAIHGYRSDELLAKVLCEKSV